MIMLIEPQNKNLFCDRTIESTLWYHIDYTHLTLYPLLFKKKYIYIWYYNHLGILILYHNDKRNVSCNNRITDCELWCLCVKSMTCTTFI